MATFFTRLFALLIVACVAIFAFTAVSQGKIPYISGSILAWFAYLIIKSMFDRRSPEEKAKANAAVKQNMEQRLIKSGRHPRLAEKKALETVAAGPPRDQDLAEWITFGRRTRVKPPVCAVIRYASREGEITSRTVDILSIQGTKHKDGSITLVTFDAYCHVRKDERTFYFHSVEAAADPSTGEEIPHFGTYVMRKMNRPDHVRRRPRTSNCPRNGTIAHDFSAEKCQRHTHVHAASRVSTSEAATIARSASSMRSQVLARAAVPFFQRVQLVCAIPAWRQSNATDRPLPASCFSISTIRNLTSMNASICNAFALVNKNEIASNINALHTNLMQENHSDPAAEEIRDWLKGILTNLRVDANRYASDIGVNQSTLSRILRGETTTPSKTVLQKIAASSPISAPAYVQRMLDSLPGLNKTNKMNIITGPRAENIPVWGVIPTLRNGEFFLNPIPISHIYRQHIADKSTKLAAFYAPDDTMSPRWHAGEPVIFDRARPASAGDYAVIRLKPPGDPNSEEPYIFRQIMRSSDGVLMVTALDDAGPTAIPLDRVLERRRVLNWSDLIG